ncbi:MAG: DEAD/DEAH box helicase, partial [Treponema sp.]|nr:DEAD/DEAH box helicase [Treponema sp.]
MPQQHLKFSELYTTCKDRAERTLASLWCGEAGNESQRDYAIQIRNLISRLFAPEDAIPMVECLNRYKAVSSVSWEEARDTVGGLWTKPFAPYEHQYQCWNTVLKKKTEDGKYKSFVVTTGTGSGKTECFMLPLVHDLKNQAQREVTEAIFLYPLNALMEDQKDRLEELLAGTDLRYCVYNGDLPEREPKSDEHSEYDESVRRKIDMIRGISRDKDGKIIEYKYKHCIATREELRKHPAEILLTNPTMLEYILLRTKDSSLIAPKSLRWIVIDETHTYTGAGAAEMAMLLRRLLLAFDLTASEIRFATSSATLGNAKTEDERLKMTEDLKKFISDLTGLDLSQIEVVGGKRKGEETLPDNEDCHTWERIVNAPNGYIRLNELFPGEESVVGMLHRLDEICKRLPEKSDLKVKVHFFFRVPNNGLFVKLSELEGGSFKIYTEKPTDDQSQEAPLIELSRCKHCGEYVAIAQINKRDSSYGPIIMDDSDMFELEPNEEEQSDKFIFAVTDKKLQAGDNNCGFKIIGDKFIEAPGSMNDDGGWRIIANTQNRCPHCRTKLTKTIGEAESEDSIEEEDGKKLQKFRFSADLISRIIAPEILDQLAEADNTSGLLHKGQQYISFVDSRQGAARGSLGQNLEQERIWVYSRIFHALNEKAATGGNATGKIKKLEEELGLLNPRKDRDRVNEIYDEIERLEAIQGGELSWTEI